MSVLGAVTFALSGVLFIVFWAMVSRFVHSLMPLPSCIHIGTSQVIHCIAAIAGLLGTAGVHNPGDGCFFKSGHKRLADSQAATTWPPCHRA